MEVKLTSSTPPDYGTKLLDEENGPPPDYDAEASKGVPPSYQSIIDKIEKAKTTSATQADFVTTAVQIILDTVFATVCLALSMAVPVAMIVMGAVYMDDCPAERMIPIYLTVFGAAYSFKASIDLCNRAIKKKYQPHKLFVSRQDDLKIVIGFNWFSRIMGLLLFGFFIAGNVWVYRIYAPSNNPTSPNYCYGPLYYFAFWVITAVYILLGLCCCGLTTICCIGFAFCFKIFKKAKRFVEALGSARDAAASARENDEDADVEEEEEEDQQ